MIVLVWLFIWNFADVTAWSLYPMYRNRLSAGFVLRRFQRAPKDPPSPTALDDLDLDADERPYGQQYWLSEFEPTGFPEVIICAAANIRNYGATSSGSHVSSFTFTSKSIGGPIVGAQPTAVYEKQLGKVHPITDPFRYIADGDGHFGRRDLTVNRSHDTRTISILLALSNLRWGLGAEPTPTPEHLRSTGSANGIGRATTN